MRIVVSAAFASPRNVIRKLSRPATDSRFRSSQHGSDLRNRQGTVFHRSCTLPFMMIVLSILRTHARLLLTPNAFCCIFFLQTPASPPRLGVTHLYDVNLFIAPQVDAMIVFPGRKAVMNGESIIMNVHHDRSRARRFTGEGSHVAGGTGLSAIGESFRG